MVEAIDENSSGVAEDLALDFGEDRLGRSKKAAEEAALTPAATLDLNKVNHEQEELALAPVHKEKLTVGRYKNSLLMIFAIMRVARSTLREGLKETKELNRLQKRKWEKLSKEHSAHFGEQKKQTERLEYLGLFVMLATTGGTTLAKGVLPEDFTRIPTWGTENYNLQSAATRFLVDRETGIETLSSWSKQGGTFGNTVLQQSGQAIGQEMEKGNAIFRQGTEASQADYQNKTQDESSEKQALEGINRTAEEIMRQEQQIFSGSMKAV